MKLCLDCSIEKPFSEWNFHAGNKDKLQNVCRVCQALRRAEGRREVNVVERARIKERDRSLAAQGKHFCLECKCGKPIGEFYPSPHGRRGLQGICKACNKLRSYNWRAAHPENVKRTMRKTRLKCKYGLSVEAFKALSDGQDGRCKICQNAFNNMKTDWQVDHCHKTGEIRGLLCSKCNTGLGLFDDSPERLIAAASYLQKTS